MRKILSAAFIVSIIITTSCSSSMQVTCPDHSDNAKLNQKTSQAYKPKKYKAPKAASSKKIRYNNSKRTLATQPVIEASNESNVSIKKQSIGVPDFENVLASIERPEIVHQSQDYTSDLDIKLESDYLGSAAEYLDEVAEVLELTASNNAVESNILEISDASPAGSVKVESELKSSRKSERVKMRELRKSIKSMIQNQPGGDKPVLGFAIAALVCGIVGLFAFGIVLGALAIIFGGIAVSRSSKNESKEGRGLAIAGLVIGLIATAGVLIFLLM